MQTVEIDISVHNLSRVTIGKLVLWFSYKTCVAFYSPGYGKVVSENYWGATTGKHLNSIDGGNTNARLKADDFERKLDAMLEKYELAVRS
jgi:hypothetical protein